MVKKWEEILEDVLMEKEKQRMVLYGNLKKYNNVSF
jgi:hypothetical protein